MGIALSVYQLVNVNKKKLLDRKLNSHPQLTFSDMGYTKNITTPKSHLNLIKYDKSRGIAYYSGEHICDTITMPIRVFVDDIIDSYDGITPEIIKTIEQGTKNANKYQPKYFFDVIIDFNNEEIYVFTKKSVANSFMKRFKKSDLLDFKHIYFDLSRIDEIVELSNVWGAWEDGVGIIKKKAYFGTEVNKSDDIDKTKVTSYYVEYEDTKNTTIDLFIAIECRISSKSSKMTNEKLLKTYMHLKQKLYISDTIEQTKEAFQEEEV